MDIVTDKLKVTEGPFSPLRNAGPTPSWSLRGEGLRPLLPPAGPGGTHLAGALLRAPAATLRPQRRLRAAAQFQPHARQGFSNEGTDASLAFGARW